jgi:5-methylcytosine-specific restriction endonuclease McrA
VPDADSPRVRERARANNQRTYQRLRSRVVALLGGPVCKHCGTTEQLEIDHVNENGREQRQEMSYTSILRYALLHPAEFQMLCGSCNRAKALKR